MKQTLETKYTLVDQLHFGYSGKTVHIRHIITLNRYSGYYWVCKIVL